jgi:hypothetical protein
MGGLPVRDSQAFRSFKVTSSTRYLELNGGNSDLWGNDWSFLRERSKKLLFFSELVGRVGIEPTTN